MPLPAIDSNSILTYSDEDLKADPRRLAEEILTGKGYVLIPNVITVAEAEEGRSRVLDLLEIERPQGKVLNDGKSERVYGLLYKGEIFERMVQHPVVMAIIKEILGEGAILGGFSAHILQPGANPMGLHIDYPYWAMRPPFPLYPVLQVQVIWLMQDFTEQNGATLFASGTQKLARVPDREQFDQIAAKITGKAGSVVLSHPLVWHDTSPNLTNEPRVSVLGNYCLNIIRPLEDPLKDVQQEVLDRASPQLQRLLGNSFWEDIIANATGLLGGLRSEEP